jgi:hypothetical protein
LLNDIRICSPKSPSHYLNILVNLLSCDSGLFLSVDCHPYTKIFNHLGALDSPDLSEVFIRKDFRLLLIESQVPLETELSQFFDNHLNLMLVAGHHKHVVCKGQ